MNNTEDSRIPLLQNPPQDPTRPSPIKSKSHFLEYLTEFSSPTKYITKYSALAYITFSDLWSYIRKINQNKQPITIQELPLPYDYFNIESKVVQIDQKWIEEINRGSPSFSRAVLRTYKSEFIKSGILMFLIFIGRLVTTLILGQIIYLISSGAIISEHMDEDQLMRQGIYFAVLFLVTNITNTHYWNYTFLFGSRVRLSIVGFVYKKLQSTALSSLQEINLGKVINLLASDLNDLDFGFSFMWPFILTPITLSLSGYTIWEYFESYTLISVAWLIVSLFLSNKISEMTKNPRIEKNAISDSRVKLSNELIECIRLIKMYAWDKPFKKAIEETREREFQSYLRLFRLQSLGRVVTEMSVYMAAFFMFAFYVFSNGVLTPEKVFATIMILTFVRLWCIAFPYMGRSFIVNVKVIQKRIEDLLTLPDILALDESTSNREKKSSVFNNNGNDLELVPTSINKSKHISPITFKNYTAYWNTTSHKPCLDNLNLVIKPGEVTAVIGKIGSGKTTFLLSMLREIPRTQGEMNLKGTVAYVEQEPIIFSGTVRDNILFGKPFDETLYQKIVRACNLTSDFTQFSDGDQTMIGEKGTTLSGGQKSRVSVARALYSRSDIYLLDDPLSAVDSKVARHLFNYAIRGDLLKDKIVILVTHHISFAKEADKILVFDDGKVIAQGNYDELSTQDLDLLSLFSQENHANKEDTPTKTPRKKTSMRKSSVREDGVVVEEEVEVEAEPEKKEYKEEETVVTFATYKNYLKASGRWSLFWIIVACFVIFQCSLIGYSRFMGNWALRHQEHYVLTGSTEGFEHTGYIFGGVLIIIIMSFTNYLRGYLCAKFACENNNRIHSIMLTKITRAFVSFFDKTPIGTILNRFSNDLGLLDKANWETFHNVLWGGCNLIFAIVTICFINPYVFIPSFIVFLGLIKIRSFFAKASVETKRLDLMSRSPLYSEISATVNGLLIIRVFRQGGRFIQKFMNILYINSKCLLFMQRTQGVFGLVIDLWLYVLTVSGIFLYIYLATTTELDPSLFGLAMVLMLDLCNSSSFVVKQTLQLDVNMQSAERVLRYCKLPEEAPEHREKDTEVNHKSNGKWPSQGEIKFRNVYMRYGQDTSVYALNGLDFEIKAGMKIGVVGRTGAGKSSIIQALFRMVEIEFNGEVLIDGVNIRQLGLEYLRKNLSIIPQTSVIFSGTIRRNLDPFNEVSDKVLWDLLEEVRLKGYVERLEKRLETDMTLSNTVFSAGQKQLICLARAILRRSKIIMLDEATANVDIETDNFIQEKINEKFKDCTVITVAHRLTTIAHYDKIVVMEKGRVVEYDEPYKLLVEDEGDKKITRKEGWFVKMVMNTGESMSKRIFEIAYSQHNQKKQM